MKIRVLHSGRNWKKFILCFSKYPTSAESSWYKTIPPNKHIYRSMNLQLSKASLNSVNYLDALQKEL